MNKEYAIKFAILANLGSSFTGAFGSASSKMAELSTRATKLKSDMDKFGKMYDKGALSATEYARALSKVGNELAKVEARQKQLSSAMKWQGRADALRNGGRNLALQAVEMGYVLGRPISAAMSFESEMAGVAKQVDGARNAEGKLTEIGRAAQADVLNLSKALMVAPNDIAKAYAFAARAGVKGTENLRKMTEMGVMMGTAFEMPREQVTQDMAEIANAMGYNLENAEGIKALEALADRINYVDDQTIAKGQDLIDWMKRSSGIVKGLAGSMSENFQLGLGAGFLSSGVKAEQAETAVKNMLTKFAAPERESKDFHWALAQLDINDKDLQESMIQDADKTILKVFERLKGLDEGTRLNVMAELFGKEHIGTLSRLASNMDKFTDSIKVAQSEAAKGSMRKEFEALSKTTTRQMEGLSASLTRTLIAFGSTVLPGIVKVAQQLSVLMEKVALFAATYPKLTEAFSYGMTIIVGLSAALGGLAYIGGLIISPFMSLWAWASKIGLIAKITPILGLITIKFVLIAAAIAAVVAAGVWLYNNWDMVKAKAIETWGVITSWVSSSLAAISNWFAELPSRILFAIGYLIGFYISLPRRAWTAVSEMANAFVVWFPQAFNTAVSWLANTAESVWSCMISLPGMAVEGLTGFYSAVAAWMQSAYNAVIEWVFKIPDAISEAFRKAGASVGSFFNSAGEKISAGLAAGSGNGNMVASNALGGIYSRGAFLTTFAEDSDEAAIPLDGSNRAVSLWQQAGQMLGVSPGGGGIMQATFSPTIMIYGNPDPGQVQREVENANRSFLDYLHNERRLSFADE